MNKLVHRTFFMLITFIFVWKAASAQTNTYHPLPESNTMWIGTRYAGTNEVRYEDYNLYISGDTTIGPYTYHKLYENLHYWCWPCPPGTDGYVTRAYRGAFRQDIAHKQVYLYSNGKDALIYNFNLNIGDTLPKSDLMMDKFYVTSIDSVIVDNQYRKRFRLNCQQDLIEGIGCTLGLFDRFMCPFEGGSYLNCVIKSNNSIWRSSNGNCTVLSINELNTTDRSIEITQNPFSVTTIVSSTYVLKNASLFIYSITGGLVKQLDHISGNSMTLYRDNLPAGIYFYRLSDDHRVSTGKLMITD